MKSLYLPEWDAFIRYHRIAGDGVPVVYLAGLGFSVLGSLLRVGVGPAGLHGNSRALVEIDDTLKDRFCALPVPRMFVYGERTLPADAAAAGPDTPDPAELRARGVRIGVVPGAGHDQMADNLDGFVELLCGMLPEC